MLSSSERNKGSSGALRSEPHFAFLVVDPNQQELLYEDEDFWDTYRELLANFKKRQLPFAILCTHGDCLDESKRQALEELPHLLRIGDPFEGMPIYELTTEENDSKSREALQST